ncbi:MAG: DUF4387 domain-containing protein [Clostridia bacterium]
MKKYTIPEVAEVIRSKNSGPYELTLDIIFKDWDIFEKVCKAKIINPELIAKLYKIDPKKVMNIVEFNPAKAIKITIERPYCSGAKCETDVYGAQQHAPLFDIEFEL